MSEIVKTDAIVLKGMKYRETSKIITFYTRRFGKVKGIAKGVRQAKNKFGSSLEPLSHVSLVIYKKDHQELHLVSQCDIIQSFKHLSDDLEKMSVALSMIELVDKISHDEEQNEPLFDLLLSMLVVTNGSLKNVKNLFYVFEIRLAGLLGFRPQFDVCANCTRAVIDQKPVQKTMYFHFAKGGPLCVSCSDIRGLKSRIEISSLRILKAFSRRASLESLTNIELKKDSGVEIAQLLQSYLRFHVEGLRNLKTEKIFSQILAVY